MPRQQDLSKAQTAMLTITNRQPDGSFDLATNDGEVVGTGRARSSKSHPGYVTLVMSKYTPVLRVPECWLEGE